MNPMLPISHLGDQRLWREDVAWLAETLAQRSLADVSERVRWLHVHLQPLASTREVSERMRDYEPIAI
jgi:hypothetical protein